MKLFRPAWDSRDDNKAVKAVKKVKNEAKLARIVKEAQRRSAQVAAAEKLSDPNLIIQLLDEQKKGYYAGDEIRFALAKKIEDTCKAQGIFAEIVTTLPDKYQSIIDFGYAVLDCITEQSALFHVATQGHITPIYKRAIERLTDVNLLYELAKGGYDKGAWAIEKLNDQQMLVNLAENAQSMNIRFWAAQKLTDKNIAQSAYIYVINNIRVY